MVFWRIFGVLWWFVWSCLENRRVGCLMCWLMRWVLLRVICWRLNVVWVCCWLWLCWSCWRCWMLMLSNCFWKVVIVSWLWLCVLVSVLWWVWWLIVMCIVLRVLWLVLCWRRCCCLLCICCMNLLCWCFVSMKVRNFCLCIRGVLKLNFWMRWCNLGLVI